jgi:hypothetical protein
MKLKFQWWILRSRCTLNLKKIKFEKNLKSPCSMREGRFHPPSVGARFKRLERKLSKGFSQDS